MYAKPSIEKRHLSYKFLMEKGRETWSWSTHSCIHWLILVGALTRSNPQLWHTQMRSNQLRYPTWTKMTFFIKDGEENPTLFVLF